MSSLPLTRLQIAGITPDRHGTVRIDFRPRRPLRFTAGQHGLWVVPGGGIRPFTMASAPEEDLVTLGTSLASRSRLKRALAGLTARDTVRLIGPLGGFTLDDAAQPVVMLAQGLGVTPFRAMLRHLALTGADRRTTLVHVGADHPFRDDTERAASTASYPSSRPAFTHDLAQAEAAEPQATFMVSGSPDFVSTTVAALRSKNVDKTRIRRDAFWGYRPGREHDAPTTTAGR